MYCSKCGIKLNIKDNFCQSCGNKMSFNPLLFEDKIIKDTLSYMKGADNLRMIKDLDNEKLKKM